MELIVIGIFLLAMALISFDKLYNILIVLEKILAELKKQNDKKT